MPAPKLSSLLLCLAMPGLAIVCVAQTATRPVMPMPTPAERRTAKAFEDAKAAGPLPLHVFLVRMPKGADLHMHLSGAIYAETFLKDAVEDGLCVDSAKLAFVRGSAGKSCASGTVPAGNALKDQHLYDALVDSFSMRAFIPFAERSGHDQFFDTFDRYGGTNHAHRGEWLDEVATRAATQNEQYLEIMETPSFSKATSLGYAAGWPEKIKPATTAASSVPQDAEGTSRAELAALREKLLAGGLRDEVQEDRTEFAIALAERARIEQCGTPQAAPGCRVEIRFLYQVLRAFPPQQVFAQTLLAFEVAEAEAETGHPNVVGLNFVQPEDAYLAMTEYHRQMMMLDYLHSVYPRVHITLHAGELAPGMVPPAGLGFHIREAVELGHAERIGHGVDVMYERDAPGLLKEMADRHIMVEINITSNDVILGISGNHHSLPAYRQAGVAVALSTDDEGVSRIDLTHEYARAATEFGLGYLDLKKLARTSLEHSFLPGESLWSGEVNYTRAAAACAHDRIGSDTPQAACASFLASSAKAARQWELESRFSAFEAGR
jgi:adenosine deaminase